MMLETNSSETVRLVPTDQTVLIVRKVYLAQLPLMFAIILTAVTIHYLVTRVTGPTVFAGPVVSTLLTFVPFGATKYVLSGGREAGFKALFGTRPLPILLFVLASQTISLAVFYLFRSIFNSLFFSGLGKIAAGELFFVLTLTSMIVMFLSSMFGTMLPAMADFTNIHPMTALKRGTTWPLFRRLLLLAVIAILTAYVYVAFLSPIIFQVIFSMAPNAFIGVSIINGIMMLFLFLITTTCAVIFSKAYLGSYTKPHA